MGRLRDDTGTVILGSEAFFRICDFDRQSLGFRLARPAVIRSPIQISPLAKSCAI